MKRASLCWLGLVFTVFIIYSTCHAAEKYPTRTIELVAPTNPGGSADLVARVYSDDLSKALKVSVNVVNRAGGAGSSGTIYVINAKKDGYTLLAEPSSALVIVPNINKDITYDPAKDLIPLGLLGSIPSVFAVGSGSPYKTLGELITFARQNPGKIRNGVGGIGTESQFNMEVMCVRANINLTTVPFQGGRESLTALLGGHVDVACNSLSVMAPQISAGKIRPLAISSKKRVPEFPDIPTTTELGYPEASFEIWFGLFAPAGIPQPVIDVLVPVTEKVFKSPEVIERAKKAGLTPNYMGPEELRKYLEASMAASKKVAKDAGLSPK